VSLAQTEAFARARLQMQGQRIIEQVLALGRSFHGSFLMRVCNHFGAVNDALSARICHAVLLRFHSRDKPRPLRICA
jgi:hypothetical protein